VKVDILHGGRIGEFTGRAGNPEDDETDAKRITASKTAHRIKRKRRNPQKIGSHHFLIFYCLTTTGL